MKRRQRRNSGLLLIVILVLIAVAIYSGLQILESTVFYPEEGSEPTVASKSVEWKGQSYFPRQDITVMMILGIDQQGPAVASDSYMNPGSADMVALMIVDENTQKITVLNLNRDTMMNIPVLGVGGNSAGAVFGQLALAHTYGTGLEDSCVNTKEAVSTFLGGIEIDYYLSIHMDAIGMLNDAVGGVRVHIVDDFTEFDPSMIKGDLTLNAEQAMLYIRSRKDLGDQMNLSRMERHREYMMGFQSALKESVKNDSTFVYDQYEKLAPYLVSDCPVNTLSSMISNYADFTLAEIITPAGENIATEEYMEYHVDREALTELVLRLFYAPK